MVIVKQYGEMWARNTTNIASVPGSKEGGQGVYVLYDGSMPVYVGKGNIRQRLRGAMRSLRRGQFWDYFSWYQIPQPEMRHDIEVLLLRRLPWYLRGLNQQSGGFKKAKAALQVDKKPEPISRRKAKA
jgi:hypothetical protein